MPTDVVGMSQHADGGLLARNHRTRRVVSSMERLDDLEAVVEQESARDRF